MRLIDADALTKPIYAEEDNITGAGMTYDEMLDYNDGIDAAWSKIVKAKTVDAVPVVRCKDCILRGTLDCGMSYECDCGRYTWEMDSDFCSHGERKDDG